MRVDVNNHLAIRPHAARVALLRSEGQCAPGWDRRWLENLLRRWKFVPNEPEREQVWTSQLRLLMRGRPRWREARGREDGAREGGVPKKGWGRGVGVDPSEAGIATWGFLPWESHQREPSWEVGVSLPQESSDVGAGGWLTVILMDTLGGEILEDVEADKPVVLNWLQLHGSGCRAAEFQQDRI